MPLLIEPQFFQMILRRGTRGFRSVRATRCRRFYSVMLASLIQFMCESLFPTGIMLALVYDTNCSFRAFRSEQFFLRINHGRWPKNRLI